MSKQILAIGWIIEIENRTIFQTKIVNLLRLFATHENATLISFRLLYKIPKYIDINKIYIL